MTKKTKTVYTLIVNSSFAITKKNGNGIVSRRAWADHKGNIVKYSLTYINYNITQKDNGRVLGYDNSHDYHHKHFMGEITPIEFKSYQDVERLFERDLSEI